MVSTLTEDKRRIRDQICSKLSLANGKDFCRAGSMEKARVITDHQEYCTKICCFCWAVLCRRRADLVCFMDISMRMGSGKSVNFFITILQTYNFYINVSSPAGVLKHEITLRSWKATQGYFCSHSELEALVLPLKSAASPSIYLYCPFWKELE